MFNKKLKKRVKDLEKSVECLEYDIDLLFKLIGKKREISEVSCDKV